MFKSKIYTIILSVCLLSSCNSIMDDGVCKVGDGVLRTVAFTFEAGDAPRQTRAGSWGDGYLNEDAIAFENRIAYDSLRVLFYRNSDNAFVGEASDIMFWGNPSNVDGYRVTCDVSAFDLTVGTEYKIMLLVNTPGTGRNLDNLTFDISSVNYPQGYIPMWGVSSFVATGEELQDVGTIDVLRAMAKVEVVLSNEVIANGYTLDGVQLTHHNSSGYCLPAGWSTVSSTTELDQEECARALHSHVSTGLSLKEVEADRSWWVYIPEFNVLHTAANRPVIGVTLGDGSSEPLEFPDAIRFGSYDQGGALIEGTEHDIVRNHIYRFNITAIAGGLEIDYEVVPWEDGGTWDRGEFAYPTYHNPLVPDHLDPSAKIPFAPVMKYNNTATPENDAFVAWFKLTRPTNQLWTPVVDKSDTEYEIRVYDATGTLLVDPADWKASDNWYRIVVLPLNAANAGSVVRFGITYTQDWMPAGTSMYLFINGTAGEIAWPDSGNDPKIIEIKQI